MRYPPEFLDEIRTRLPVSRVVGRSVALQRRGREFVGLSPFNKEKTPSFTVNDEKGFFHCFSSQEHGDIFGFLMKTEGLGFAEAVERLAGEAGLEVPVQGPEDQERARRRSGVLDALEAACRFFQTRLREADGRAAVDYLRGRGLDDDAAQTFRLGYAPADSQALLRALATVGIAEDLAIEAGLAKRPDDGRAAYAFFRNRVVFPVGDARDRVVGFGARLIDGDGPKYINSPDGPVFQKGTLLYGLARARRAAHGGAPVIVAEGYMDVIALVRAGFNAAVAPLGTALTERQAQVLWGLAPEPILCFDGDAAGRRAAGRAAERVLPLLRPDHSVRVALLPPGQDPDDLIRTEGAGAMQSVLDRALPLAEVLWELECGRHRLDRPEGRAGLQAGLDAQADRIGDPTVARFYRGEFRDRVRAAFTPVRDGPPTRALRRTGAGSPPPFGPRPSRSRGRALSPELMILGLMTVQPDRFEAVAEDFGALNFDEPELARLHQALCTVLMNGPDLDSAGLSDHLAQIGMNRIVARLRTQIQDAGFDWKGAVAQPEQFDLAWQRAWRAMEKRRIEQELADVTAELRQRASPAMLDRQRALIEQRELYRRMENG